MEAFTRAQAWVEGADHWESARVAASRAFVIERSMSPERIAMLSLAHDTVEHAVGAEGYVEMARQSRGSDFASAVLERRADSSSGRLVAEAPPRRGRGRAHASAWSPETTTLCARGSAACGGRDEGSSAHRFPGQAPRVRLLATWAACCPLKGETEQGTTSILVRGGLDRARRPSRSRSRMLSPKRAGGWSSI